MTVEPVDGETTVSKVENSQEKSGEKEHSTVEPVDGNSQEKSGEKEHSTVEPVDGNSQEKFGDASSDKQNDNDLSSTDPAEDDNDGKVDTGLDVPGKGEVATDSTDLQTSKAEYEKAFGPQQRT